MTAKKPVIVTLQIDPASQSFFNEQRRQYFPPDINYIDAHLTLFHNLPGQELDRIIQTGARICEGHRPFAMVVSGIMKLGRGVAYKIESNELLQLRVCLSKQYDEWLVKQDRQKFRPHITVQNKVTPAQSSALYDHLSAGFERFTVIAEGLQFWFYESGPTRRGSWSPAGAIAFRNE